MTVAEMAVLIGKAGLLSAGNGLRFTVRVVDVRTVYGRTDVLVEPLNGTGRAWVERSSVQMIEKA